MVNKKLIIAFAIVVAVAVLVTLIAVNFNGWGTALSGVGGPAAASIYRFTNMIPTWISSGGWPSLGVGILVFVIAWPLFIAAIVWQKNVPYVLGIQHDPNSSSGAGNYQSAPNNNLIPLNEGMQSQPKKE